MLDPNFFQFLPDSSQIPATPSRLVGLMRSQTPHKPRLPDGNRRAPGRVLFQAHAYLISIFTLRGRYMLYLCLLNPESNQRALLAGPSQGALVNEYTAYEQAALSWLQEAGFDMAYVDLDALSAETRLATLARLPFSQARDLGPEPEEFPPLVSPKTPPLQQQLLGNQTADAMVERLRQLLLRT